MTSAEFFKERNLFLQGQEPYLVLSKEELLAEHDTFYRIGDTSIEVTEGVQKELDKIIGITSSQREGIEEGYGSHAIALWRNSIAMSNSVSNPSRFALVANSRNYIVDGIVPLKNEAITMESFFDLLEMFLDKHSYEVSLFESAGNGVYGITARLNPLQPEYDVFFGNDEFMTNGLYIKWNLGEIEVGNYYVRLVCSNGAVETRKHSLARINSIGDDKIKALLNSPGRTDLIRANVSRMKEIANDAFHTMASLSEVWQGKKMLIRHGAPKDLAEQLMPYTQLLQQYAAHGYDNHVPITLVKSNINVWDLYNNLTEFATHTPLWAENDNRRSSLMQESLAFLQRQRDIKNYVDIFSVDK